MRTTKLVGLVAYLLVLALIAYLFATLAPEQSQIPLGLLIFLIGLALLPFTLGGGVKSVEKDTVMIRKDVLGHINTYNKGAFFFAPPYHSIEACMPGYPLKTEFSLQGIDTQTPRLQQIKLIKVRVLYTIIDFQSCFEKCADIRERIYEIENTRKLKRENPALWKQVLGEVIHGIVDDGVRDAVWTWAEHVVQNPDLKAKPPFDKPKLEPEHDPYALSLNRIHLADKVAEEVGFIADTWGIEIRRLAFENIEIDPELIKRKTRNKDNELEEAQHDATKDAIAIKTRGMAEAEVRAQTVARVIEVLINNPKLTVTDQLLSSIVRAAMYTDGEMLWTGTIKEKLATDTVKAA